jgi:hypothetical protein
VVFWTFDFQQGVLALQEFLFAALRGGRCSSAPKSSWMGQTASAPTSGALLMYPFFAERPHIAVGIKGPMNFWIWYEGRIRKRGQSRVLTLFKKSESFERWQGHYESNMRGRFIM